MNIISKISERLNNIENTSTKFKLRSSGILSSRANEDASIVSVKQKYVTKELTNVALQRLEELVALNDCNATLRKEKLPALLIQLKVDIELLNEASKALREYFEKQGNDFQKQLEQTLRIIGNNQNKQQELRSSINNCHSTKASDVARLNELYQDVQNATQARQNLENEIANFNKKYQEYLDDLTSWNPIKMASATVSGFINALIDVISGKTVELSGKISEISELNRLIEEIQQTTRQNEERLTNTEMVLQNLEADLEQQKNNQQYSEIQQKTFAQKVVFAMNISAFYQSLIDGVIGVSATIERVSNVARRLNEEVIYYGIDGTHEKVKFKIGLLKLGKDVDLLLSN